MSGQQQTQQNKETNNFKPYIIYFDAALFTALDGAQPMNVQHYIEHKALALFWTVL
jgi:hypothetical protein